MVSFSAPIFLHDVNKLKDRQKEECPKLEDYFSRATVFPVAFSEIQLGVGSFE